MSCARQMYKVAPQLMRIDQRTPAPDGELADLAKAAGPMSQEPFRSPVTDFYMTNPIARASKTMAECSALEERAEPRGRGVNHDRGASHPSVLRGRELRLHVGPVDHRRLSALGRPQDLGGRADAPRTQRRRPLGPVPVLRRPDQVRAEGSGDPRRRQQGRVHHRPAGHRHAVACGMGGGAGVRRLLLRPYRGQVGDGRHQCRHPLSLRALLAWRLWRHHGRLGVELEVSLPLAHCAPPRRWCPTRSRSAS